MIKIYSFSFLLPIPRNLIMWSNLPFDLLAYIFTCLSPDSLARAKAACRNWRTTAESLTTSAACSRHHPPWFIALPTRNWAFSCYVHNPIANNWHILPLDHTISPIKPIATTGGLILLKITNITSLQLAICNPFTKQFKKLPDLNFARTNPAVGIVENSLISNRNMGFKIYVAGGMSRAKTGGSAIYQPTTEIYDSDSENWEIIGEVMPIEIAVRLTVWAPNESVYSIRTARAYSVMGLDIFTHTWRELSVPLADKLEFAALVPRNGKLAVVGGACGWDGCVWELGADEEWSLIGKVPIELGVRLLGNRANWGSVKCVGIEGAVCLYKELGTGFAVWRDVLGEGDWEWDWIDGCCAVGGREVHNFPIRGFLIRPKYFVLLFSGVGYKIWDVFLVVNVL